MKAKKIGIFLVDDHQIVRRWDENIVAGCTRNNYIG